MVSKINILCVIMFESKEHAREKFDDYMQPTDYFLHFKYSTCVLKMCYNYNPILLIKF